MALLQFLNSTMNQKTITNQILEQKNFTLNSTLNYLFNISNMKKLFSYLLISSMVILSSCTNYDDQFDDLNSQITSLKSQIEGFSSLSSGLTALQGTVSSLQSAVAALPKTATPATDISGLEASVAALQASLASASTAAEVSSLSTQLTAAQAALATAIASNGTAAATNATDIDALQASLAEVQATLAELKTSLSGASTTAEITALSATLVAVQTDLATLLAQNNVYTPDSSGLIINSAASLDVAASLGSKLTIINGGVTITNTTATALDATKLQTVIDAMNTITGLFTYTQSGDGSAPNFDKITSVGTLTIDNEHAISLASLTNVGTLTVSNDVKVTSFSAPKLATVTFASHTLDLPKATKIDLTALAAYGNNTLTINGNNVSAGYDLMLPAIQSNTVDGIVRNNFHLTIGGVANNVTLPLMVNENSRITANDAKTIVLAAFKGTLDSGSTSNHVDVTLGAAKNLYTGGPKLEKVNITGLLTAAAVTKNPAEGPNFDFDSAAKLVSATIAGQAGDVTFNGNTNVETVVVSADGLDVDLNGATSLVSATISGDMRGDIDATGATSLETISITGAADTVTLSGNTSLTGVTMTGSAQTVIVTGAAKLASLDLAYTTAFPADEATGVAQLATTSAGHLSVYNNAELTSLKADKVTGIATLKVYKNPVLASVSFDAITGPAAAFTGTSTVWVGATTASNVVTAGSVATMNKLHAQSIVEGADVTLAAGTVKTTATITSNSGLKDLAAYLVTVAADTKNDIAVFFDGVDSYTTKDGTTTTDLAYADGGTSITRVTVANVAANTADTADDVYKYKNSLAYSITGLADSDSGTSSAMTFTANGSQLVLTKLSTETVSEFIARVNGASGLTSASITAGEIDEVGRIEMGTATTSAYTATILFGSTAYASSTSTPTDGTNAKVVLALTASTTATKVAQAVEVAAQFNAATGLKMQSFNSTTYSQTGNYTTTSSKFHDLYTITASGNYVVIGKKKTVSDINPAPAGTATNTVVDRTASAPVFRLFDNDDSSTFGSLYSKTNGHYVMLADDLFGANNTPGLAITFGSDHVDTAIVEEYLTYDAVKGTWATRSNGAAHHGLEVRGTEFDNTVDGAASNKRTNSTNPVYVTTYYTWL
ncbi:hypothetical protein N8340_02080 [Flavobacteriaceae bacterium]|nr:hypothetical protein [Flavobacteriaceae bacterium]